MKALDLASEFRRILTALSAFNGTDLRLSQDDDDQTFPAIIIECEVTPLDSAGRCLSYFAKFSAQTHSADEEASVASDAAHAERVSLLQRTFFGATANDL